LKYNWYVYAPGAVHILHPNIVILALVLEVGRQLGLRELIVGPYPGSEQWSQGQASKMRATDKLDTIHDVEPGSIFRDCTHMETVVFKGKKVRYTVKDRKGIRRLQDR
jgi:hypothetical protein